MTEPLPTEAARAFEEYREWFIEAKPTKYFLYRGENADYPEGGLPEDTRFIATLLDRDEGQIIIGGRSENEWDTGGFYVCQTPQSEDLYVEASHEASCEACDGAGYDENDDMCPECNGSGAYFYYFRRYLPENLHPQIID